MRSLLVFIPIYFFYFLTADALECYQALGVRKHTELHDTDIQQCIDTVTYCYRRKDDGSFGKIFPTYTFFCDLASVYCGNSTGNGCNEDKSICCCDTDLCNHWDMDIGEDVVTPAPGENTGSTVADGTTSIAPGIASTQADSQGSTAAAGPTTTIAPADQSSMATVPQDSSTSPSTAARTTTIAPGPTSTILTTTSVGRVVTDAGSTAVPTTVHPAGPLRCYMEMAVRNNTSLDPPAHPCIDSITHCYRKKDPGIRINPTYTFFCDVSNQLCGNSTVNGCNSDGTLCCCDTDLCNTWDMPIIPEASTLATIGTTAGIVTGGATTMMAGITSTTAGSHSSTATVIQDSSTSSSTAATTTTIAPRPTSTIGTTTAEAITPEATTSPTAPTLPPVATTLAPEISTKPSMSPTTIGGSTTVNTEATTTRGKRTFPTIGTIPTIFPRKTTTIAPWNPETSTVTGENSTPGAIGISTTIPVGVITQEATTGPTTKTSSPVTTTVVTHEPATNPPTTAAPWNPETAMSTTKGARTRPTIPTIPTLFPRKTTIILPETSTVIGGNTSPEPVEMTTTIPVGVITQEATTGPMTAGTLPPVVTTGAWTPETTGTNSPTLIPDTTTTSGTRRTLFPRKTTVMTTIAPMTEATTTAPGRTSTLGTTTTGQPGPLRCYVENNVKKNAPLDPPAHPCIDSITHCYRRKDPGVRVTPTYTFFCDVANKYCGNSTVNGCNSDGSLCCCDTDLCNTWDMPIIPATSTLATEGTTAGIVTGGVTTMASGISSTTAGSHMTTTVQDSSTSPSTAVTTTTIAPRPTSTVQTTTALQPGSLRCYQELSVRNNTPLDPPAHPCIDSITHCYRRKDDGIRVIPAYTFFCDVANNYCGNSTVNGCNSDGSLCCCDTDLCNTWDMPIIPESSTLATKGTTTAKPATTETANTNPPTWNPDTTTTSGTRRTLFPRKTTTVTTPNVDTTVMTTITATTKRPRTLPTFPTLPTKATKATEATTITPWQPETSSIGSSTTIGSSSASSTVETTVSSTTTSTISTTTPAVSTTGFQTSTGPSPTSPPTTTPKSGALLTASLLLLISSLL